jgi:hypothetical protein
VTRSAPAEFLSRYTEPPIINVQFVSAVVKNIVGSFQARADRRTGRKAKTGEPILATDISS